LIDLITGNEAAAWGARLAKVDYVPIYPITPQTEIVERLSEWAAKGLIPAKITKMESEHSMVTAAGAAALAGARVFTATSSQGLLYAFEMLYNVSGWRAPMVMVNVSRGLASPLTLLPDHNDVFAARDSGFLQFHAENCQEALDSVILAYKIAEDKRVMLPALVNLDGFYLSYTREEVDIPDDQSVSDFLGNYPVKPFSRENLPSMGITTLDPSVYSYFRYQAHLAQERAKSALKDANEEFKKTFGRSHEPVQGYMDEDADYVLIISDSFTTSARAAIKKLRDKGTSAGVIKLWVTRPFPSEELEKKLRGKKGVAVYDQDLSPGLGGVIYQEVAGALYGKEESPKLASFIGGLGGKPLTELEVEAMLKYLREGDVGQGPHLLFTDSDLKTVRFQMELALKGGGGVKSGRSRL